MAGMASPGRKVATQHHPAESPNTQVAASRSSRALIIFAFAAIYLIWGSTYLAIRYAIETLPPFLMAATRFLTAGAILFTWSTLRGTVRPSFAEWRRAFAVGALLLLCGNGGVTWAEKYVPSGLAALLVATEPLWVVMLNSILSRKPPGLKVIIGVLIGLAGVTILVGGGIKGGNGSMMSWIGTVVVLASGLAWAGGSVYSNRRPSKTSAWMASAMQMLAGGCLLLLMAAISGDFKRLSIGKSSWTSIAALSYLIVFGSLVAFTAYSWLLRNVAPARAATYAYVNPVVAVVLGWLIASEPITGRTLVAAAVIVGSVVLITTFGTEGPAKQPTPDTSDCPSHPCA